MNDGITASLIEFNDATTEMKLMYRHRQVFIET